MARPAGLRLILAYKLVKGPLLLALAAWLWLEPDRAFALGQSLAEELSEHGPMLTRAGRWVGLHLSDRSVHGAAILAGLDAVTTFTEGLLLLSGKVWGEWLVTASLAAMVPFEVAAVMRKASAGRITALVANLLVVGYLARRRLRSRPQPGG